MNFDDTNDIQIETDYFVTENGETFAGRHLIVELWGAERLNESAFLDKVLRDASKLAGATILHSHLHQFDSSGGVTGVVLLAESHISIHTWPERDYAALDIFMCGDCDPKRAEAHIVENLNPDSVSSQIIKRGKL